MRKRAAELVQTDHLPPGHTNGQPNHDIHRANDKAVAPPFALRNVAGTEDESRDNGGQRPVSPRNFHADGGSGQPHTERVAGH